MAFRVEAITESPVWCFAERNIEEESSSESGAARVVYAGTGPLGVVLRSTDLSSWTTFMTVDDCHVRSVFVWANALFVGTQPKGRIYVHNFNSGQEYLFVETEDEAVTAFAEYGGKLFAGTSPAGIVYSFDGLVWKEEYRPYGRGVTTMVAHGGVLMVFSLAAEGPVAFNGSSWTPYPYVQDPVTEAGYHGPSQVYADTVASYRNVQGGIHGVTGLTPMNPDRMIAQDINGASGQDMAEMLPASPQFNVMSAVSFNGQLAMGGSDDGLVITTADQSLAKLFDIGAPVSKLLNINNVAMMAASDGTLFLVNIMSGKPIPL